MLKKITEKNEGRDKLKICKNCFSFYYSHSWHFEKPDYLNKEPEEEVTVFFSQCPACVEETLAAYDMEYA